MPDCRGHDEMQSNHWPRFSHGNASASGCFIAVNNTVEKVQRLLVIHNTVQAVHGKQGVLSDFSKFPLQPCGGINMPPAPLLDPTIPVALSTHEIKNFTPSCCSSSCSAQDSRSEDTRLQIDPQCRTNTTIIIVNIAVVKGAVGVHTRRTVLIFTG